MDALIFDFDGIVVDSEPIHLRCFQNVLQTVGVTLTVEDYYGKYLGFDDYDCFVAAMRNNGVPYTEPQIAQMIDVKTRTVRQAYAESVRALPGAVELIRTASTAGVPLAVCSGALREEIEQAARAVGVLDLFAVIVAARDVSRGKPDPEGYRQALDKLRQTTGQDIRADRCVAVEDSPAGIDAAKGTGMKVLAVTNSYPADALASADRVVESLAEVDLAALGSLV
ncbi:MAG TPA: HAD family phosphatase [Phycisphaerae bacterium]|nr:HAD family phosphatase [Phycisphaerae bacterium]